MAQVNSTYFDGSSHASVGSLPDRQGALTICGWYRTPTSARGNRGVFCLYDSGNTAYADTSRGREWNGYLEAQLVNSELGYDAEQYSPYTLGSWWFIALVYDAGDLRVYRQIEGGSMVEHRDDVIYQWASDTFEIGRNGPVFDVNYDGNFAYWGIWNRVFNQTELEDQAQYSDPVISTNLFAWFPLVAGDTDDDSGNAHHFSVTGTATSGVLGPDLAAYSSGLTATVSIPVDGLSISATLGESVDAETTIPVDALSISATLATQTPIDLSVSIPVDGLSISATLGERVSGSVEIPVEPSVSATLGESIDVEASLPVDGLSISATCQTSASVSIDVSIPADALSISSTLEVRETLAATIPVDELSISATLWELVSGSVEIPVESSISATLGVSIDVEATIPVDGLSIAASLDVSTAVVFQATIPVDELSISATLTELVSVNAEIPVDGLSIVAILGGAPVELQKRRFVEGVSLRRFVEGVSLRRFVEVP